MVKTVLNVKTDKEVKDKAKEIAGELGLPLSTIVNAYLKDFIRNRSVTFSTEPQLKPGIGKLLSEASKDFKKGKNTTRSFKSPKEAIDYLHL